MVHQPKKEQGNNALSVCATQSTAVIQEQPEIAKTLPTAVKADEVTSGFRDPSFGHNRQYPVHRWVPWVAGFSAHFVHDCLREYIPSDRGSNAWVLDPFAGVGTTLLEAYLHGYNVVGFEINPYAVLATTAKLDASEVSRESLADYIGRYEQFMDRYCGTEALLLVPNSKRPDGFSGRTELYSPEVERQVLFTMDFIKSIRTRAIRDLFRLGFGAVMVSFSNYTYEPSLTRRVSVGKPAVTKANVKAVVAAKLAGMLEDVIWMQDHMAKMPKHPRYKIVPESIFSASRTVPRKDFVDVAITSPPYLNNYHYPRNTRPQIHWLGFSKKRGYEGANESQSFGKFWQTVRDLPEVKLTFELEELADILQLVRSLNNEKEQYGGTGWANYIATYFNDTYHFCKGLGRLLRPDGTAIIVLGNSVIQGVEVPTDQIFGHIAELCGLKFEKTILLRNKRTGSSIIQSSVRVAEAKQKVVLYESAIVIRRQK